MGIPCYCHFDIHGIIDFYIRQAKNNESERRLEEKLKKEIEGSVAKVSRFYIRIAFKEATPPLNSTIFLLICPFLNLFA